MLKALHENDSEPEPGNENVESDAVNNDVKPSLTAATNDIDDEEQERLSHYYALACMLKLLNSGDGSGNLFSNDKLID